jgi:DNA-binding transcriptional LysR family regulator
MELRDIEYFAVIAEHGNVRRASEALDLSPPALSKSLRRLEKSLQAKLVKRTAKGVELTAVGTSLLSHVQRIRLTFADLLREATDLTHGTGGHLRIGVGVSLAETLPDACAKLLEHAPKLTMEISVTDNDVIFPALRKGELDIIFNVDPEFPSEGLVQEHLYYDDFVVCSSVRHPLARVKRVSMEALAQERWTLTTPNVPARQWLDRAFHAKGLPSPHATIETRSARLRFELIAAAGLLGFMSRRAIRSAARELGIKELASRELTWHRSVRVIYRKDAYLSPAARRMIAVLRLKSAAS